MSAKMPLLASGCLRVCPYASNIKIFALLGCYAAQTWP